MSLMFFPLPASQVDQIRQTGRDSYGNPVERGLSDGVGFPCRACLQVVPKGAPVLTLAHRPFEGQNPFAETGPIYLCERCDGTAPQPDLPAILDAPDHILRGYSTDERIVYGTGQVIPRDQILHYAAEVLARADVDFVDIRSARNNCFLCRIRRGP